VHARRERHEGEAVEDRPQVGPERVGGAADVPAHRPRRHPGQHDAGLPDLAQHLIQAVQPPHRQQVRHAAAADPDHVLLEQQRGGVGNARHREQVQVGGGHPGGLARLGEQGVEPLLVPACRAHVADPRRPAADTGQLDRVVDQRGELEHRARPAAEAARGRQDRGF